MDVKEVMLFEPLMCSRYAVYFGEGLNHRIKNLITNISVDFSRKWITLHYTNGFYRDDSMLASELLAAVFKRIALVDGDNHLTLEYRRSDGTPVAQHRFYGLKVKHKGCLNFDVHAEKDAVTSFLEIKFKTVNYSVITREAEIKDGSKKKSKGGKK